ncbi:MAG TPA: prolipoprotein diacylglyceryl transferase family protein, partial [Vicinamibacteria bacterium]|nr:prolipoprotein diacylglyceryl transferase family protein [Vicinamibacteria bacterium]
TRTGCFLNGCDFGIPAAVPWAVRFPRDRVAAGVRPGPSPAWQQHFETGASFRGESVGAASAWSLPVHPTQIYEAALGVVLFAVLLLVWRRKRFAGEVFLVLIIGYGLGRALIECFRGDALRGAVGPLSTSQVLGLATALAAALAAWKLRGRRAGAIG